MTTDLHTTTNAVEPENDGEPENDAAGATGTTNPPGEKPAVDKPSARAQLTEYLSVRRHPVVAAVSMLCVAALGDSVLDAQRTAYAGLQPIQWASAFQRSDISWRAIAREASGCSALSARAWPASSMPRVAQVSRPIAFTSRIMAATLGMSRSLGERQAAPMQKREAPAALACRAFSSTASVLISLVASTPV